MLSLRGTNEKRRKKWNMSRDRNILDGKWVEIETEQEFCSILQGGFSSRVQKGSWSGPGRYYLIEYTQPCPRGCCRDDVREFLTADEVVEHARDKMRDLASLLKSARKG